PTPAPSPLSLHDALPISPLSPDADAAMDQAWRRLTDSPAGKPMSLTVLGRNLPVPQAARGVARFSFEALCDRPLAAADYLAIARSEEHTSELQSRENLVC